jgi:hypothetical protein
MKTYIYSYVKSLYNGFFDSNLSEEADLGKCFIGHASFYRLLKSPSHQFEDNDVFVSSRIYLGDLEDKKKIINLLIAHFPFLDSTENYVDGFGTGSYWNQKFEQYLNIINKNLVVNNKRPENNNSDQKDSNKSGKTNTPKLESKSFVRIVDMTDSGNKTILIKNNIPLTNAFCSEDNKTFYFINPPSNDKMSFNSSVYFNRANFIGISDDFSNDIVKRRYYNSVVINDNKDFLCAHDVHAITMLRSKFLNYNRESLSGIVRFPIDKIPDFGKLVSQAIRDNINIENPIDVREFMSDIAKEIFAEVKVKIQNEIKNSK